MTTGTDLLTQSLRKAGILGAGEDAEPEDLSDALDDLNDMIAQWAVQRWLVFRLRDVSIVSTGAQSYTVGPTGDITYSPRPDKVSGAYIRQMVNSVTNRPDTPLRLIEARETYSRICLKRMGSFPEYLFYDPDFPNGVAYPWPVPSATIYELHLLVKEILTEIATADLATAIALPRPYFAALKFNLARRLRSGYRLPADAELNTLAADALAVIRGSNVAIPTLELPGDLIGSNGIYNIYNDQVN